MVLLATSPGPGGASSVLTAAEQSMPFFGGEVKATLSIPNFFHNFDEDKQQLKDDKLKQYLIKAIEKLG
ncbi:hypothetical protein CI610_03617 [invertebrate metagenome]|uniref:NADPH-dependent FMN reductase-like domain-containing protein n=1 Tax=invertebrate metagenome TaxID=1711999 RepID=A0A2H9T2P1_9ZZZZ